MELTLLYSSDVLSVSSVTDSPSRIVLGGEKDRCNGITSDEDVKWTDDEVDEEGDDVTLDEVEDIRALTPRFPSVVQTYCMYDELKGKQVVPLHIQFSD